MKKILIKPSDNRKIDLTKLTMNELYKLHYEEEKIISKKLKSDPPFLASRANRLKEGMEFVYDVMAYRESSKRKRFGFNSRLKMGASIHSLNFLKYIIDLLLKKNAMINFYEAGVGTCYIAEELCKIYKNKIFYYGCDVFLDKQAVAHIIKEKNVCIIESNIYDDLTKIDDNSIDIFYADNVCEHFFPDEADLIYELIFKKLKKEGIAIILMPNRYIGPCDISGKFLPMGSQAEGFHFMEKSYRENVAMFKKYDMVVWKNILRVPKGKFFCIKHHTWFEHLKENIEPYLGKVQPPILRKIIFTLFGYTAFVLSKKKYENSGSVEK